MEKDGLVGRARKAIAAAAEGLDLPAGPLMGMLRISMEGDREVLIERHGGIIDYSDERMLVAARGMSVEITGEKLTLVSMTRGEMRIRGEIAGVQLLRE